MHRRNFLKLLATSTPLFLCGCSHHILSTHQHSHNHNHSHNGEDLAEVLATNNSANNNNQNPDKVINFDQDFPDDLFCSPEKLQQIKVLVAKFRAVQRHVGHGNFNLLGMDEFIHFTQIAPNVTALTPPEKLLLEELFYFDAHQYGFYGDKTFKSFTETINSNSVEKVPYTGHFLRKGKSLETYQKIVHDVGNTVILTSGVRSLAKQFHLFLEKTLVTNGNLSRASRSLAPPGYSFHGHEDFDIGRINYGLKNFTDDFAKTDEFKTLQRLGYVEIRYTEANSLGVRFEPWHIKVS